MDKMVYRGEIYYIHDKEVSGSEMQGGRLGIVISNDVGNEHSPVVVIAYLTTREKKNLPTHVKINSAAKPSIAMCEQIATVYKGRIGNYIGQVTDTEQKCLDKALAISIGLGLSIKSNKIIEKWAEAYRSEEDTELAQGTEVSEGHGKEPETVSAPPEKPSEALDIERELIKATAERDVYKELYMDLLRSGTR